MKVGKGLLDVIHRAERLLERIDVAPQEVQQVVQQRRYRDTFSNGTNAVDDFLASNDFKQKYEAAIDGTSYRAGEAKKVERKFEALFQKDSFEAFKRAPVTFKAADLQRVYIAG